MSEKGNRRQAKKVRDQRAAARLNKAYYQSGGDWKNRSTDAEAERREKAAYKED